MTKIQKIISSLVVLVSITLIIVFRTVPSGKLWDKYVVLYVPAEVSDTSVLSAISDAGINEVVSLTGQFLPLNISQDSIEYAMYKTNIDSPENDYIRNRNAYFFDKSNSYRLYYIPVEYENKLNKCISILKDNNIESGIDRNGSYPVIYPIVVFLITIAISFYSRKRSVFIVSAIVPLIYVFSNPFFPIAIAISLLILCSFLISNIWKREGALKYLRNFIFIPICVLAAILCSFASSLISGFLFIAAVIGTAGILISYYWIEDYLRERKSFVPVYIRPAKMVSIFAGKTKTVFGIVSGSLLILLVLFIFTSSGLLSQISAKVQLPSEASTASASLPQFDDYYKWTWNINTNPYKSLNSNYEDYDSISFPTYTTSDSGLITVTNNNLIFDENYKNEIFENIDNLPFNSIEKVMSSEGANFSGGYNSTSSYHIDLFGIIMIIICYSILLFIYFSIIIRLRKGKKGTKK